MDISKLSLFSAMKQKMSWLSRRQEVLATNIANADTPNFKPSDLKPLGFAELLGKSTSMKTLTMAKTRQNHLSGDGGQTAGGYRTEITAKPYETAPNGNAVVLEEQMAKINETTLGYRLSTEIYKKHLTMIKTALGN